METKKGVFVSHCARFSLLWPKAEGRRHLGNGNKKWLFCFALRSVFTTFAGKLQFFTMPEISIRGHEMPESPIRKLAPLAAAAKKRGTKVYHLNIGQPDLPTPREGLEALKNINRDILEYSPSQGYQSYREKLVGYYKKYNINVCADDIIITSGGSEAVLFAFLSCLNPGDEIIVPEPAYANYMAFAISAGAKIKTIATTIDEGFSLPKVEKFEELINERTRAIMICNPNNPTGYLYTRREMNQIRDLVKKYDLYLFSDAAYREYIYTGSP